MKLKIYSYSILFIILSSTINSHSQNLTIEETLEYIEKLYNETNYNKTVIRHGEKINQRIEFNIDNDGYLISKSYLTGKLDNTSYYNELGFTTTAHLNDLNSKIKTSNSGGKTIIEIPCKYQNCITYQFKKSQKNYRDEWSFFVTQEYSAKKLVKALNYLFSLVEIRNFNRDENDPFSLENESLNKKQDIALTDNYGTYTLPVNIGGIINHFTLDTGASETTINSKLEKKLISNGAIKKENYLADGLYRIADGSIISQRRLILKEVVIGDLVIKNLIVSVGNSNSPLLLGRNFLDKFNNWSIDNESKLLTLNN